MSGRFPCGDCGTPIEFEEWERGGEAYCPVCGRPSLVPAEGPAQASSSGSREATHAASTPAAPEVFGKKALEDRGARIVGRVDCPQCRSAVPVTALDHGGSTYCPACGAQVPVGEALVVAAARKEPPNASNRAAPAVDVGSTASPARRAWLGATAVLALAGAACVAAMASRLTPEAPAPAAPASTLPSRPPDAFISLEAIDALGQDPSREDALIGARVWLEMLRDEFHVDPADPRIARLEALIRDLQKQLEPSPGPPSPEIAEFNKHFRVLLGTIESLRRRKTPELAEFEPARQAIARADELLAGHPETLEPLAVHYRKLRADLLSMVARIEGSRPIMALLDGALKDVDAGTPTAAMEKLARARLLAVAATLDEPQRAELNRRIDALVNRGRLSLSLCRRDIDEAEKAGHAGDHAAREWLARQARAQLHRAMARGTGEDGDTLRRIEALEKADPGRPGALPADLVARKEYEDVLETFATWFLEGTPEWIDAALKLDAVARRMTPEQRPLADNAASLALGGLRARVDALGECETPESISGAIPIVDKVQQALSKLGRWKGRPEFRGIEAEIRRRRSGMGQRLLAAAEKLAREDRLAEALELAGNAAALPGEPEASRLAAGLADQYRKELDLRASRKAQDEAWAEINRQLNDREFLDAWSGLLQFERRFKDAAGRPEFARARKDLEAALARELPGLLTRCAELDRAGRTDEFHRLADRLERAPIPPDERDAWESINRRRGELDRQADELFERVPVVSMRHDSDDIIAILEQLAEVLKRSPGHPGAQDRLRRTREKALPHAARLLESAEQIQRAGRTSESLRDAQRKRLRAVLKLQPDGKIAEQATALLRQLGG